MKSCPVCGATASDDDAFCEVDGTKLVTGGTTASPARMDGAAVCGACGTKDPDEGDGYCKECGHKVTGARSTLPGATPAKVGDYTVSVGHGEGDVVVKDPSGGVRLLVFGAEDAVGREAAALRSVSVATASLPRKNAAFPAVLAEGSVEALGHYIIVDADLNLARPLEKADLMVDTALRLLGSLLDAAAAVEACGFAWQPVPSDLRVSEDGGLQVLRLRGARPLQADERLNAKKVLEALGSALVPSPLGHATPAILRLVLPRTNFSTRESQTIESARAELTEAAQILAARPSADMAELCDPGLRRNHNEDATALAEGEIQGEPYKILVVCDGVSSSTHADEASTTAAKVTRDALAHFARSGDILREGASSAVVAAIRAAHIAICTSQIDYGAGAPPGTTIVVALVFRKSLTVGWVGDSRAYWVSDQGAELCTTDHSWLNDAMARGQVSMAEALLSPLAHALTRCLGPLETDATTVLDVEPDVRTKALPGPGRLVLCTDGLWNYFPEAKAMAGLVHGAGKDVAPTVLARFLVCQALSQGGGDNVSVAVLDVR